MKPILFSLLFFMLSSIPLFSQQPKIIKVNPNKSHLNKKNSHLDNVNFPAVDYSRIRKINLNVKQNVTVKIWVMMAGMHKPIKIDAVKKGDYFIYQDDILIHPNQILDANQDNQANSEYRTRTQALVAMDNVKYNGEYLFLWQFGKIPYTISSSIRNDAAIFKSVQDAISDINRVTGGALTLKARSNEKDYLDFKKDNSIPGGGFSSIGRVGGKQELLLSDRSNKGTVLHEILHAAGVYHEHTRVDRDNYVSIQWSNIEDETKNNFMRFGPFFLGDVYSNYDYGSIMHYPLDAFAKNNIGKTIIPLKSYSGTIGHKDKLSAQDIHGLKRLYSSQKWMISIDGTSHWQHLNASKIKNKDLASGDFNGDGKTDIFYADGKKWQVSYGGVNAWQNLNTSSKKTADLMFGDFNGDGKTDVFYADGKKWQVSYSGSGGWVNVNKSKEKKSRLMIGDFNGDRKSDIFLADGKEWLVSYGAKAKWINLNKSTTKKSSLIVSDFNGDGKSDVLHTSGSEWKIIINGRGNWKRHNLSTITKNKLQYGDFNGDGKSDIFYADGKKWQVSYSGSGRWKTINKSSYTNLKIGHFDDNRKSDVITSNIK